MKKIFSAIIIIFSLLITAQNPKPKLVVGIVVDQMRNDYLYRFYNDFGNGGFKRLMSEGFMYHNMHYNYVPTYTAPGHASIYTGTTPAYHGIVGNDFFNKFSQKEVYCTDDDSVQIVGIGAKETEGKMSPKNLRSTTITDELKLASNFKSKVYGVSIKDRGAILPAGHFADFAFWLSDNGNFISSTFYGKPFPAWVEKFNNEKRYMKYINSGWNLLRAPETYNESQPDNSKYEGRIVAEIPSVFPYNLDEMYGKKGASVIKFTPFGNDILEDFAKEIVVNENLGKGTETDFLAISFSSTDYIGHVLGARSMELQDTYLRLDATIEDLLNFLDKQVGKGNYLIFLTADHACADNSNFLNEHHYAVKNIKSSDMEKLLTDFSVKNFGANYIKKYDNQNIYFNQNLLKNNAINFNDVKHKFQEYLENLPYIRRAYTSEEILLSCSEDLYLKNIARGYDVKLSGEMVILYQPAYMEYGSTGTTHGTPYNYDTHVPALFYGSNIPKGNSYNLQYITSIAPTIAQLLKVGMPNSTEGKILEEIIVK